MKRRSKATKAGRRRVQTTPKPAARKTKRTAGKTPASKARARSGSPSAKRAAGRGRRTAKSKTAAVATRRARKASAAVKPARAARPKAPPKAKPAPATTDPSREIRRLQTARRSLERQLTAAVQEIGILRQWEVRARLLETELEKRNERLRELEERLGGADLVRQPRLL